MKLITLLLFCFLICQPVWGNKPNTQTPKTAETALKKLVEQAEKPVNGPFLLTIKKVTQDKLNYHLHSALEADKNMVIEVPPFMQNHYQARTLADMERIFLNHQVLVKGSLSKPAKNPSDSQQDEAKTVEFPKVKLIFIDQLTFYD